MASARRVIRTDILVGLKAANDETAGIFRALNRLDAEARRVNTTLERTERQIRDVSVASTRASSALAGFGRTLRNLGAVTAAVQVLRSLTSSLVDTAQLATALDLPVAQIEAIQRAGAAAGLAIGETNQALVEIARRAGQAAEGNNEFARSFRALGVELKDAGGRVRGVADVFGATLRGLAALPDSAAQLRAAEQIFGSLSVDIVNLARTFEREAAAIDAAGTAGVASATQEGEAAIRTLTSGLTAAFIAARGGFAEFLRFYVQGIQVIADLADRIPGVEVSLNLRSTTSLEAELARVETVIADTREKIDELSRAAVETGGPALEELANSSRFARLVGVLNENVNRAEALRGHLEAAATAATDAAAAVAGIRPDVAGIERLAAAFVKTSEAAIRTREAVAAVDVRIGDLQAIVLRVEGGEEIASATAQVEALRRIEQETNRLIEAGTDAGVARGRAEELVALEQTVRNLQTATRTVADSTSRVADETERAAEGALQMAKALVDAGSSAARAALPPLLAIEAEAAAVRAEWERTRAALEQAIRITVDPAALAELRTAYVGAFQGVQEQIGATGVAAIERMRQAAADPIRLIDPAELEALEKLAASTGTTFEAFRAQSSALGETEAALQRLESSFVSFKELGVDAVFAISNQLSSGLTDALLTGTLSFGDFTRNTLAQLSEMIIRALVLRSILGALSAGGVPLNLPGLTGGGGAFTGPGPLTAAAINGGAAGPFGVAIEPVVGGAGAPGSFGAPALPALASITRGLDFSRLRGPGQGRGGTNITVIDQVGVKVDARERDDGQLEMVIAEAVTRGARRSRQQFVQDLTRNSGPYNDAIRRNLTTSRRY